MIDTIERLTQAFPAREFSVTDDRCDRCSAEAMFAIEKTFNDVKRELHFCSHHFTANEDAIVVDGWEIFCNSTGLQRISA